MESSDVDWKRVSGELAMQVMQSKVWHLAALTRKKVMSFAPNFVRGHHKILLRIFISANSKPYSSCNLVTSIDSSRLACFGFALNP